MKHFLRNKINKTCNRFFPECSKSFVTSEDLSKHVRVHSAVKDVLTCMEPGEIIFIFRGLQFRVKGKDFETTI